MSASVMQLPSSCTRAAGVEGGNAFWDRRLATRGFVRARLWLATRLGEAGGRTRLRAREAISTDILHHETLAVHSAEHYTSENRRSPQIDEPRGVLIELLAH